VSVPKFVITLWAINATDRGRDTIQAVITDARDIGVSSYANKGGETFFTLPQNHPQIAECVPWQRHYEVKRFNANTNAYDVVGVGLLNDYEATPDEVIVYGQDYLSLFDLSISGANTSYTSIDIGTIIQTELSAAIFNASGGTTKSVQRPIALGTISTTGTTVTVLTSYQSRLQFVQQLVDIYQSDSSVRPIVSVTRSAPFTISFTPNLGSDKTNISLAYGGLINDFRYVPGYADVATQALAIGQKREGASLLFSAQNNSLLGTDGLIQRATVFLDITTQASLDAKTKRYAKNAAVIGKKLAIALRINQLGPWEWGELADSLPTSITRGIVNFSGLYTVWGQEWTGKADGSEDLFLSILPKET
jgi:hypothetical protein